MPFFSASGKNSKPFFQPKLTVGPGNDVYEREADAVADQVMRMAGNQVVPTSISPVSVQRMSAECEEEERVQRKEKGVCSTPTLAPAMVNEAIQSGGKQLDNGMRSFMESRFGYDFSQVKIHTDTVAAKSAGAIKALAYTSGNHVVFNEGQYAPETDSGKKLLAHELTHVVQQSSGIQKKMIRRKTDKKVESGTGVDKGISKGTLKKETAIMGKTYSAKCRFGGYTVDFKFTKAYKGTYPYQAAKRDVKGVYVKIETTYTDHKKSGRCSPLRLLQTIRNTKRNKSGTLVAADPKDATRRERSGWNDPKAPSRGWRVDTSVSSTDPYYSSSWVGLEGSDKSPAILWDTPGDWSTATNAGKDFYSCAVCQDASSKKWVAGCVHWGYYINSSGDISFLQATPVATCSYGKMVKDASERWDAISGNTATGITF